MDSPHFTPHPPISDTIAKNKNYVIIVAGGSGTRMKTNVPKQFLLLNGRPVLMYTIAAFHHSQSHPKIIVVLPADFHAYWEELCEEYNFYIPQTLIKGGETRFHSVKNGLAVIPRGNDAVVAIHDAVRPLVTKKIIDESFSYANEHGNAITALKSRDSVRQVSDNNSVHLHRDKIYLIQTPQTFKLSQLKKAYEQPYHVRFTDDASVVEQTGERINFIVGSYQNIKITFPEDIAIAESLIVLG